jgi:2-polyprenyl-3-methyl-5-hydroxy-6-metoxy-1,4-benzoquinol methylase
MSDKLMTWEQAVMWLRDQPDQQAMVKACFYDDPLMAAAERYYLSSEWAAVSAFLPRSPVSALDIGAGRGIASYALAKQGHTVTALEPNDSLIVGAGAIRSLASETGLDITVEQSWGERLPFADATFQVVHARQVLHHAQDLKKFCMEASRVLKKGGIFIATREHVISSDQDLETFHASHSLHSLYGGEHAYRLVEYVDAIESAGITLKKILNPYASDINLYPENKTTLKQRIARKIRLLPACWVPDILLDLLGKFSHTPGRLYTFVGYKHD